MLGWSQKVDRWTNRQMFKLVDIYMAKYPKPYFRRCFETTILQHFMQNYFKSHAYVCVKKNKKTICRCLFSKMMFISVQNDVYISFPYSMKPVKPCPAGPGYTLPLQSV